MSKNISADIEIRTTPILNQKAAYKFHIGNMNPFLIPRAEARFHDMIMEREVYEAFDHTSQQIVGVCYITKDSELCEKQPRAEFGGVYVSYPYRKSKLVDALAAFAISKFSLDNMTGVDRLISHVHQYNISPLPLMSRLGFKCFGAEIPPLEYVKNMKPNKHGYVIGLLFIFWKKFFVDMGHLFKMIENEQFEIRLKDSSYAKVKFDLYTETTWDDYIHAVKNLSKESSFRLVHKCHPCIQNAIVAWIKTFFT